MALSDDRPRASSVSFSSEAVYVRLQDGREISLPLDWLPALREANDAQRAEWRLIEGGAAVHWDELDEDVLVEDLLAVR